MNVVMMNSWIEVIAHSIRGVGLLEIEALFVFVGRLMRELNMQIFIPHSSRLHSTPRAPLASRYLSKHEA